MKNSTLNLNGEEIEKVIISIGQEEGILKSFIANNPNGVAELKYQSGLTVFRITNIAELVNQFLQFINSRSGVVINNLFSKKLMLDFDD